MHEPDPWLDDVPSPVRAGHDRLTDGWDADVAPSSAPATRAATPAMWAPRPSEPVEPIESVRGPVTDPFGFPPVPPVSPVLGARDDAPVRGEAAPPAWAAWVPERRSPDVRSPWAVDVEAEPQDVEVVDEWSAASQPGPPASRIAPPDRNGRRNPVAAREAMAPHDAATRDAATPPDADGSWAGAARSGGVAPPSAGGRPDTVQADPPDAAAVPNTPAPPDAHSEPLPDPVEAAALAGAFAADYLSWDEDDPARRGRALADHLSGPDAGHALLGWSGAGRQRAEIVLPGAVRPDGGGRLVVDVRVRVVPYRRVSRSEATPEPDPDDALGTPAAAPPVTARGWRGLAARWVRLGVGVVRDGDRLVVDAGEETLDDRNAVHAPPEQAPRPVRSGRSGPSAEDPTLDGDDDASPDGPR
ncbi:hypothetical protein [Pseudonocardia endophytica]|uniref:hypothetical protein n=1 Tax=Pseudonocardia endophytica TaxID=401976 RepID=UPI001052B6AE|nr:hypothetical protein [Pseudonocardia endophytica]